MASNANKYKSKVQQVDSTMQIHIDKGQLSIIQHKFGLMSYKLIS
jgi:hypothetical protein